MDKAHGYADKTIDEIEKELKEIYATAQKQLAKKAEAYMNKFIAEDEKQRKLLEKGELSKQDYTKWLKKKVMSGQRFTKMKEQCAEQLTHANEIALDHINDRMADVYAVSYNALEKDVKGISGYSFHIVSPDTVKTLAGRDSSLLPYKKLDPAKDIPWNMKAINSEVLQGVLQGESVKAITKRVFGYTTQSGKDQAEIAHKMRVAAARTAQTLITAAENKGRMDSYDRAAKDGVIIEKEWIATNDHATRDSHRDLDGTSVPEDKPFDNGLMFPGDWSGPPEEVYNCRCTMAAVVKGFTSVHNDLGKPTEHTVVEGHDISDTWERRADEFKFEINDVINAQGFDGLPRVVSAEEFDELVKENNIICKRGYTADTKEELAIYHEALVNGEWYVDCSKGGSAFGKGMYSVGTLGTVLDEQSERAVQGYGGFGLGKVETFTLDHPKLIRDADIKKEKWTTLYEIEKKEIEKMGERLTSDQECLLRWLNDCPTSDADRDRGHSLYAQKEDVKKVTGLQATISQNKDVNEAKERILGMDNGVFAAMRGYDAIQVDLNDREKEEKYFVVLNRTKCIFLGDE